ncbi:prolactin regulatory element-binding protein-like [Mya arenaria]|uniref:prolactin regulatory element-binding protein-like n=1 Tax=Mya arenaria TaxID=6604 RepID=UPI0022E34D83|nr:prolactin regulatory element-binding protein-like [Mya arenaria]
MAPERGSVIAKSNFPMYSVKSLDERHFLVAGGGGQAKTGVSNAIEIYELRGTETGYQASSVCAHDVGSQAPMNGATVYDGRNHLFAAGMDDECHLFSMKYKVVSPAKTVQNIGSSTEAVKRKSTKEETNGGAYIDSNQTKRVTFDVGCLRTVKTDFLSDGGFQKCVQFSPDRSIIATGGGDGHLRIWKTEDLSKLHDIAAHKSEIDDLDFSPRGDKVVTISRGSSFSVWNVKDGKRHLDMEWPGKTGEHRFRACRFGVKAGSTEKGHTLYTINIPVKRSSKPDPCFIAQWDGETYKPRLVVNAGTEVLSSMAVSRDGIYVGVGMITGSVAVYIAFSLQKLYYVKEAHSIFVTGLDFMPTSENAREVTGTQDFHLLSISADNTIRLHQEPTRASYSAFILIIGLMMAIAFLFWTMAQLGL